MAKKITFESVIASVSKALGKKELEKDASGKLQLTAEDEIALKDKFGKKFLENFKAELSSMDATTQEDDQEIESRLLAMKETETQLAKALQDKKVLQEMVETLMGSAENDDAEKVDMSKPAGKVALFKPNMAYEHNKFIENIFSGNATMQYAGDDTVKTDQLSAEFGAYVSGQKLDVFKRLNLELSITNYMTTIVTDKSEWRATQAIITSVLQQFTPKWTPKGSAEFTPITVKNFDLKVNYPITPSDILDKYIAYLYDENKTPDQMPLVPFILNELVLPQLAEDLELALATAKFVERTKTADGQAGSSALESMDGVIPTLEALKAKAGNKVTWLLNGVVLTPENILEKIDQAVDAVPYKYKKKSMLIHSDPDLITMYRRAYRAKYPVTKNEDENKLRVDFSNFTFAPIDGAVGTGVFFITPKQNFIHLMSRNPNDVKVFMQVQNYDVKIFMQFKKGVGFAMQEAIFAYLPPVDSTGSTGNGL